MWPLRNVAAEEQWKPDVPLGVKQHHAGAGLAVSSLLLLFLALTASASALGLFFVKWFGRNIEAETQRGEYRTRRFIKNLIYAECFIRELAFTCIISTSYPLVQQHGGDATFSGILIAGPKCATVFVAFFSDKLGHWSRRSQILLEPLSRTFGTALFVGVSLSFLGVPDQSVPLIFLMIARLLEGAGEGIASPAMRTVLVDVSLTADEQDEAFVRRTLFMNLGMGMGPFFGSIVSHLAKTLYGETNHVEPSMLAYFTSLVILIVYLAMLPGEVLPKRIPNTSVIDMGKDTRSYEASIWACLLISFFRFYGTSNLESAMALILEREYDWSPKNAGFFVANTFLICIPVHALWKYWSFDELRRITFIRWSFPVCAFFALLLHPGVHSILSRIVPEHLVLTTTLCLFLISDCGQFPLLYLSGGLFDSFQLCFF